MADITTAARGVVPSLNWQTSHEGSSSNCDRPYAQTGGQDYYFPDQVASSTAVRAGLAKILQIAKDAAAKIQATEVSVMADQPGHHDVWFTGPTGTFIKIS